MKKIKENTPIKKLWIFFTKIEMISSIRDNNSTKSHRLNLVSISMCLQSLDLHSIFLFFLGVHFKCFPLLLLSDGYFP